MRKNPFGISAVFLLLFALPFITAGHLWARADKGVRLSITPPSVAPNQVMIGSAVTLTATLDRSKDIRFSGGQVRYRFRAERTWPTDLPNQPPCQQSFSIAENSSSSTVTWTAPKAGRYTFTVEGLLPPSGKGGPPVVGAWASISNYYIVPTPGFGHNWVSSFSPPSGTAPVNVTLSGQLTNLEEFRRWIFTFNCATCNPKQGMVDGPSMSASWNTTVLQKGQNTFWVGFNKIRPSDCQWLQHTGYGAHDFFYAQ